MAYQLNKTWVRSEEIEDAVVDASTMVAYQSEANRTQITTDAVADTYAKMDIPVELDFATGKLSLDVANKRIVHTGATTTYLFNATATADETDTVNNKIHFCLHVNGVIVDSAVAYALLVATAPNADAQNLNAATGVIMNDGDYAEVWAKSNKAGSTFYCNHLQLQFAENIASTLE